MVTGTESCPEWSLWQLSVRLTWGKTLYAEDLSRMFSFLIKALLASWSHRSTEVALVSFTFTR